MTKTAAPESGTSKEDVDAVVVGAGLAGLGMVYHLVDRGFSVRAFEAANDVGGTWYWNRYPGARCDSPVDVYCYFFSDELLQSWNWSSKYPRQPELLRYFQHVADRFDLRQHITFETRVVSARFDEERNRWVVKTDGEEQVTCKYLITAVGCLSSIQVPDFPGLETFRGEWYHSARWPHEGVDFAGKRVGIIGTGSTGIQATPLIAAEADHLTVFQRTPNFSLPARDHRLSQEQMTALKQSYRTIHETIRHTVSGQLYQLKPGSALDVPADERLRLYEKDWAEGGFHLLFGEWEDLLTNEESNTTAADFVRSKIAEIVQDPHTRELLQPRDHPIGTKRPALDSDYFETFNRDNVSLVDVRAAPIVELTEQGVRTTETEYELDCLVFATGFDAITGALLEMDIRGRGGLPLKEKWVDGPTTYLGLGTEGFPNLFTITGPGSPAVLGNMPITIEQHLEWIRDCLEHLRAEGLDTIEATSDAEREWTAEVEAIAAETLMVKVNSWYMGSNIPGKPRRFVIYLGGVGQYGDVIEGVAGSGYPGFTLSSSPQPVGVLAGPSGGPS